MITVNGIRALSCRFLAAWAGVWIAELPLDLQAGQALPSGRVVVDVGGEKLSGTVDPRGAGTFGAKAAVRVVGGGLGWEAPLERRDFHNDAGVTLGDVVRAAAVEAGEVVAVTSDRRLAVDYVRPAGRASRILDGLDWRVTGDGSTVVGPRVPAPLAAPFDLLDWDPVQLIAAVGCASIVWPGSTLADAARLGPDPLVVHDVEQIFGADGSSRATVYGARASLAATLATMVEELGGLVALRSYPYRIVSNGVDGRLTLQAVDQGGPVPDVLPIEVWAGMPGDSADPTLSPETVVLVEFVGGDLSRPIVRGYAPGSPPVKRVIDAVTSIEIGAGAVSPAAKAVDVDQINVAAGVFASAVGVVLATILPAAGPTSGQLATFSTALSTFLAAIHSTAAAKAKVL